jgi:aryl-alcohol dehydrogenase-like predicted oxidoreductase
MGTSNERGQLNRRAFLATAAAGAATIGLEQRSQARHIAPKLPQRPLGRTGESVSVLGLGTSALGYSPPDEAAALLNACVDAGVTYIDIAPESAGYGSAQDYLARLLRERRREVFLAVGCWKSGGQDALGSLEQSLRELGIEQADLVYAQGIGAGDMTATRVTAPDGVCKAMERAKKDGLARFFGVSAHNRHATLRTILDSCEPDVVMTTVGLVTRHVYDFETTVWPVAVAKGSGLVAMRIFGGSPQTGQGDARTPKTLRFAAFRYALGLPGLSTVLIGMRQSRELTQNLKALELAKPLSNTELQKLEKPTRELADLWGQVYGPAV